MRRPVLKQSTIRLPVTVLTAALSRTRQRPVLVIGGTGQPAVSTL